MTALAPAKYPGSGSETLTTSSQLNLFGRCWVRSFDIPEFAVRVRYLFLLRLWDPDVKELVG